MRIQTKIILAIVLTVLLSITGVSIMVSVQMRSAFVNNFNINSEAQLQRMSSFTEHFFENAVSSIELLAESPLVLNAVESLTSYAKINTPYKPIGEELPEPERALYLELARIVKAYPAYDLVYVGNKNSGFTQAPNDTLGANFDPLKRDWYKAAIAANKTLVTEAYISDSADETVCTVATPVRLAAGDPPAGVIGFDISLLNLTKELGSVDIGKTGYVIVLDALGQVVIDPRHGSSVPEEQRWLGKTLNQLPADVKQALEYMRAQKNRGMVSQISFLGKDWLANSRVLQNDWTLIMLQEQDEVFADAMEVTIIIILVGAIIIILMSVLAWFVARSISGPISILAKASQGVANGDLNAIPENSRLFKAELQVLHSSLLQMVSKLLELIDTANSKMHDAENALLESQRAFDEAEQAKLQAENARSEGVRHAAEEISAVITQLSEATASLSSETELTEQYSTEQLALVIGTATAIQQMNQAVGDVAHSASRTAQLAEKAKIEAQSGKTLVLDVVSSMGKIEQQSHSMSQSLAVLGKQSNDIGQIMGVINDIADQTNLLALNAAIEAARAGEAGRGFAVVADEVRKLAEKTMEATKQVGDAITMIQQGAANNITAMREADQFITSSTDIAHKAGEALSSIEEMFEHTANEVRSIATASEEQSATTEEINRSTENIKDITDKVSTSAKHSSSEVASLLKLSQDLTDIVNDLRKS